MSTGRLKDSLLALSRQQGHYGSLDVDDVVTIVELQDDRIKQLQEQLKEEHNENQRRE